MGVRISVSPRDRAEGAVEDAVYEFDQDRIRIGRGAGSDVALPHRSVSVKHATIEQQKGRYVIVDHGATNGTRVNGQRIVPERAKPLRDGDRIDVGAFVIAWKESVPVARSAGAERTASLARRLLRDVLGADAPPRARLVVTNGTHAGAELVIPTPPARLVVGRADTCDLAIPDADASREHVELVVDLDGVVARDRSSKNGLVVNERRIAEKRLADRDELLVGSTVVVFEDAATSAVALAAEGDDERISEPPPPEPVTEKSVPAAPADDPDAPTGDPEATWVPPPPPLARHRMSTGELLIYALAALVFLASVGGLFLLLRSE